MANKRTTVEPVLRLTRAATWNSRAHGVARVCAVTGGRTRACAEVSRKLVLPDESGPFHFTHRLGLLCADICQRLEAFSHIDMQQVLVTFVRARNRRPWGLQAKLVPLRFRGGKLVQLRRGHPYRIQQLFVDDVEIRYVLSFYLPRFLDQSFDEKMITVFHELYHIGPDFRGDIRRFASGGAVHDGSQRRYDAKMAAFAREYLAQKPPRTLYDFLRLSFDQLEKRYQEVVGVNIPAPKLIPTAMLE